MDKKKGSPKPQVVDAPRVDSNTLLNSFLIENNLILEVSAISDDNSYVEGKGFVLTDKPLLIVSARYRE